MRGDMDELSFLVWLKDKAKPTQAAWAKTINASPAYVSDVLNGRREPGPKILEAVGFHKVTAYRPISSKALPKGETE